MKLLKTLFLVVLVLFVAVSAAKTFAEKRHRTRGAKGKCNHLKRAKDKKNEDDDFPDVEDPIIATFAPPNVPPDPYLDTETYDDYIDEPPELVDFIVIKHRFSNATNLAFPPYAYLNRKQQRGKKRSGIKSPQFERRSKNRIKTINTRSSPKRRAR